MENHFMTTILLVSLKEALIRLSNPYSVPRGTEYGAVTLDWLVLLMWTWRKDNIFIVYDQLGPKTTVLAHNIIHLGVIGTEEPR